MTLENKKGDMTVTKLVSWIFAGILLTIIIIGTITGGLKPLEEKIATQINKVILLFIKDKPITGDCQIYSTDCPGGCIKANENWGSGDFSLCHDACYLVMEADEFTEELGDIIYKYDFKNKKIKLNSPSSGIGWIDLVEPLNTKEKNTLAYFEENCK